MLVISVRVEENSKASDDSSDDSDCRFVDGELVVLDETRGDGVEGQEQKGQYDEDGIDTTLGLLLDHIGGMFRSNSLF